jgi:hypothetical protein
VYRQCIFCHRDLGRNDAIEIFPVGRRLAFDSERGRLWVVCPRCSRWNLTPVEERWEAIEECERGYRSTPTRVSTGQIGWGRLPNGLDLIRIGRPLLPEFAGWRYGRVLIRRHRKVVLGTAVGMGGVAAATVSVPLAVAAAILFLSPVALFYHCQRARSAIPRVRIRAESGAVLAISALHMPLHRLCIAGNGEDWELEIAHSEGTETMSGPVALHALTQLLPSMNATGASRPALSDALADIGRMGDGAAYLRSVPRRPTRDWNEADALVRLPRVARLALEIAANEERERRAVDGEMVMLERAWRDAESIATIADNLLVPDLPSTLVGPHSLHRTSSARVHHVRSERSGDHIT